jgi:hypothetical protein
MRVSPMRSSALKRAGGLAIGVDGLSLRRPLQALALARVRPRRGDARDARVDDRPDPDVALTAGAPPRSPDNSDSRSVSY